MPFAGGKVYVHGRLRGLTRRGVAQLAIALGATATRQPTGASIIVLAHSSVSSALSDTGEIALGFAPGKNASFISEVEFKRHAGIKSAEGAEDRKYSSDRIAQLSGLTAAQICGLALYDVLRPAQGSFSYTDLVAARSVARLFSAGASLRKIAAAAIALEQRGMSLAGVRLSEAPWGEVLQEIDGQLARFDGQLFLPLRGEGVSADEAFGRAEAGEAKGDMPEAQRWYELAARLDRSDAVIPFNLGNVLDALGRTREAEIAYRQAIARSPDLADAWFNLGVLQEKNGRKNEALASYERAAEAEPTFVDAHYNAALLHMGLGQFGKALPVWERIAATSSEAAVEAKRLAHLCRLELTSAAARN
jgi:tetratricopeptide (TPR) repeat protein